MVSSSATLLLIAPAYFHLYHLKASNHAEHLVLQDAYETATKCADDILEQVLSLDEEMLDSLVSLAHTSNWDGPSEFLQLMISELTSLFNSTADNPALQNVVQDALTSFRKLKYQLGLCT